MNIAVYCSSSDQLSSEYYHQAEQLGEWIAENNHTLVYGGSRLGLMESVARGVKMTGGHIIGVLPYIIKERNLVSQYIDETIFCEDLTERKKIMMEKSEIFIVMPGSIGTLDEAFSVMAQHIIGINSKMVIFWNINGFWNELFKFFDSLKNTGVIYKPIHTLYYKADSIDEIEKIINL